MGGLIALASVLGYLLCGVVTARKWYAHIRPWTEPVACAYTDRHKHADFCYRRWGEVDNPGEAAGFAALAGLLGPFWLLGQAAIQLVRFGITHGQPQLPEERDAALARLERETGMKGDN